MGTLENALYCFYKSKRGYYFPFDYYNVKMLREDTEQMLGKTFSSLVTDLLFSVEKGILTDKCVIGNMFIKDVIHKGVNGVLLGGNLSKYVDVVLKSMRMNCFINKRDQPDPIDVFVNSIPITKPEDALKNAFRKIIRCGIILFALIVEIDVNLSNFTGFDKTTGKPNEVIDTSDIEKKVYKEYIPQCVEKLDFLQLGVPRRGNINCMASEKFWTDLV
ncbi:MAG: hypothetical protein MJE68_26730, partial [Proteobacteria bacterium]|nr:hypothetical protein [Pseudomonadota bacterium]